MKDFLKKDLTNYINQIKDYNEEFGYFEFGSSEYYDYPVPEKPINSSYNYILELIGKYNKKSYTNLMELFLFLREAPRNHLEIYEINLNDQQQKFEIDILLSVESLYDILWRMLF